MLFRATEGRLERSDIVFEFLSIMRSAPILPLLLRPLQALLVRAAVDLIPDWAQQLWRLDGHGLHGWEVEAVKQAGTFADRLVLTFKSGGPGLFAHAPSSRLSLCRCGR